MDSEQDISADEAQDETYAGAGARLRAAREAEQIELSPNVAAETRIPLRHLEAIEAGAFFCLAFAHLCDRFFAHLCPLCRT